MHADETAWGTFSSSPGSYLATREKHGAAYDNVESHGSGSRLHDSGKLRPYGRMSAGWANVT